MSTHVVNMPASAERGTGTELAQDLRLVEIKPKLRHSDGLQPRPKNII